MDDFRRSHDPASKPSDKNHTPTSNDRRDARLASTTATKSSDSERIRFNADFWASQRCEKSAVSYRQEAGCAISIAWRVHAFRARWRPMRTRRVEASVDLPKMHATRRTSIASSRRLSRERATIAIRLGVLVGRVAVTALVVRRVCRAVRAGNNERPQQSITRCSCERA
jgi:hypothetical protein